MLAFEKAARQAETLAELNTLFGREIRALRFDTYAVGFIPCGEDGEAAQEPFLLLDWPPAWLELYARQGFAQEDAVVAAARHATEPFTWRELQARQPGASARIFAAAAEFGWHDGLLVPIRQGNGTERVGVASLAARTLDHLDVVGRATAVELARSAFHRAVVLAEAGAPPATLTPREREVLLLVAKGHDDAEIGAALGLSKSTAHSYVENAKRRLGAATRAQAVATALTRGLIELRSAL